MDEKAGRRRRRTRLASVGLNEVAAHARVSTATVSRVLNGSASVSDEVRDRVARACRDLGYVPNGAARALSSQKTMTIGAVVPTIENDGFALAVSAFQRRVNAAGYTLLLASSNYEQDDELSEVTMLISRGIDGLMLVGGDHHPRLVPLMRQHGVPFIETWTCLPGRLSVGVDNVAAARELTRHVLELGHTRVGLIAGRTSNNDRASAREEGVRACLREHGLALQSEWFIERPYRIDEGRLAMRSLICQASRPTAIICGNDQLAFGALIEANLQGLRVPEDVSLAGFNDLEFAEHLNPPLTTIRVPAEEIGGVAADLLLRHLSGATLPAQPVEIPFSLIVRATTAPPSETTRMARQAV